MNRKEAKMEAVLQSVLRTVSMKGPDRITMADIARSAKVSRSWIYKYLARSPNQLLEWAVKSFGERMTSLNSAWPLDTRINIRQRLMRSVYRLYDNDLMLLKTYMRYFLGEHKMKDLIQEVQLPYLKSFAAYLNKFEKLENDQALKIAEMIIYVRLHVQ